MSYIGLLSAPCWFFLSDTKILFNFYWYFWNCPGLADISIWATLLTVPFSGDCKHPSSATAARKGMTGWHSTCTKSYRRDGGALVLRKTRNVSGTVLSRNHNGCHFFLLC